MTSHRESSEFPRRRFLQGVAVGAMGLGLVPAVGAAARAEDEPAAPAAPAAPEAPADSAKVKRRVLGRTGREVSVIGVGGGAIKPENSRLLQAAWDHGIDFIDVAWGYGNGQAELGVGLFLESFADREKLFLSTKASWSPPRGSAKEVYDAFKAKVEESLARMKTAYVDLLMWPHGAASPEQLKNEAMQDALRKLKEEGLVRHFGVSSHANYAETALAAVEGGFYDVVLTVVNVCTQNAEKAGPPPEGGSQKGRSIEDTKAFLAKAKEKDVGVMVMKAANPGFLAPATDDLLAAEHPADSPLSRHQKLYAYALKQEGVSTVLVGLQNVKHLQEAVAVGVA